MKPPIRLFIIEDGWTPTRFYLVWAFDPDQAVDICLETKKKEGGRETPRDRLRANCSVHYVPSVPGPAIELDGE